MSAALAFVFVTGVAGAQGRGDYLNVESPQVHPIEVATVGGRAFLLVCNTPDSSVEIYDTEGSADFLARVPVGLEPVSVRWVPELGRFYTADFLGDSLTAVALAPGAEGEAPRVRMVGTRHVGDEPMDVAFYERPAAGGGDPTPTLFVPFMSLDGVGWFHADTLEPVAPGSEIFEAAVEHEEDSDLDDVPDVKIRYALKAPRTLLLDDGWLVTLGGRVDAGPPGFGLPFEFAINCRRPESIPTGDLLASRRIGGLGSFHFAMARAGGGDLFVVGADAQNHLEDEPVVAEAPTGFVQSTLYMVRDVCGTPRIRTRDVNLTTAPEEPGPVAFSQALAQPTSVVPFERPGEATKVFFTAFGSDRVGIAEPDFDADPRSWRIRRLDVEPGRHPMAGPRGLALKTAPGEPRLYVLNRLDNSVSVFDPVAEEAIERFPLRHDPTPPWVRRGQRFLYSAELSGSGFVSCASCHVDARTDGLPWDLGTPDKEPVPIPAALLDGDGVNDFTHYKPDKGDMITQNLQGLLNWEVEPGTMAMVTNAPYHWRADRADLAAFNVAFEDLMRGRQLSAEDMRAFEEFVNSIHYGPNPKQPRDRRYSGEFGDPDIYVYGPEEDGSSGALRGQKIFFTVPVDTLHQRGIPCARCHHLPDGSNGRLTQDFGEPMETPDLRGLFQFEGKRDVNGYSHPSETAYTSYFGMVHNGIGPPVPLTDPRAVHMKNSFATISSFVNTIFARTLCPDQEPFCPGGRSVAQYVHELDWGTGPLVGSPRTVTPADAAAADDGRAETCDPRRDDADGALDCMEEQSRLANSAVAVRGSLAGRARGFWYDPRRDRYIEEPEGGQPLARRELLALLAQGKGDGDYLTFLAAPLGDERRLAAPSGKAGPLSGPPPSAVELLPMAPNTANTHIPSLTLHWADLDNEDQESNSLHALRVYQHVLAAKAPELGVRPRHDAPRRFRVAGRNLRPGAELHLHSFEWPRDQPLPETPPALDPAGPLSQVPTRRSVFPLYPTGRTLPDGREIWETAVELDVATYTTLMLGWRDAPGVREILGDLWVEGEEGDETRGFRYPDPPDAATLDLFDPEGYNRHYVRVVNSDGSRGDAEGWQRITVR